MADPVEQNLTGTAAIAWKWTKRGIIGVTLVGAMATVAVANPAAGLGAIFAKTAGGNAVSTFTNFGDLANAGGNTLEFFKSLG